MRLRPPPSEGLGVRGQGAGLQRERGGGRKGGTAESLRQRAVGELLLDIPPPSFASPLGVKPSTLTPKRPSSVSSSIHHRCKEGGGEDGRQTGRAVGMRAGRKGGWEGGTVESLRQRAVSELFLDIPSPSTASPSGVSCSPTNSRT